MELIDTHAHLTFEGLIENIDTIVDRARTAGVGEMITIATEPAEFGTVIDLAKGIGNVHAAVGIHPHHAKVTQPEDIKKLRFTTENENIVAVGETGLDFHYNFSTPDQQAELFREHLKIAADFDKPVIIHSRVAMEQTLKILDEFGGHLKKIVFHCYSEDAETAKMLLDRGYYISFTGVVTFKNADIARQAAKVVPLDRLMIETDCPFMSPVPMRKQKINEPALLVHTAKFLAELKGVEQETFADEVTNTSRSFFGI